MSAKKKILVLSYCDSIRTKCIINHASYCDAQGYEYIYDIAPTSQTGFFSKIEKILKFLPYFDYVFWIDDDAFFMQFDKKLEDFINTDKDFIFCASPVNDGRWTYLSSGNFFIKNTASSTKLLQQVLNTSLEKVETWWDVEKFGDFTRGDQDVIVYCLQHSRDASYKILEYSAFNSRPYHFINRCDEHFLVHFTGHKKQLMATQFAKRFQIEDHLTVNNTYQDPKILQYLKPVKESVTKKLKCFLKKTLVYKDTRA